MQSCFENIMWSCMHFCLWLYLVCGKVRCILAQLYTTTISDDID